MQRQLRSEVGGLSVQLAERLIGSSLTDEDRRRQTVDSFLDELDGLADGRTDGRTDGREAPAPAGAAASPGASSGGGS